MVTVSPGFLVSRYDVSELGVVTAWRSTDVITSPAATPAESAGPPGTTPATTTPPASPPCTRTPRKAVAPTCTRELACPAATCFSIDRAFPIGMAYESAADETKRDDVAVSMPMTFPAELTSGPPESPGCSLAFVSIRPARL